MIDDDQAPSQMPFFAARLDGSFYYTHLCDGRLINFSHSVTEVLGYSAEDCQQHFFSRLTESPVNQQVHSYVEQALQGVRQDPFELEIVHCNGQIKRLEITMVPHYDDHGQLSSVESIAHDITRLHSALVNYRRKSFLLDEIEEVACMGTWDWNLQTNEVRWSEGLYKIIGVKAGELAPLISSYSRFLKAEDSQTLKRNIVTAIKSHSHFECAHRLFLPHGNIKYIETRGKTLEDGEGNPVRMIGTVDDITEQIEAHSQLEKVYSLINSSVNEIYLFDTKDYQFSFVSEGACKNLGYTQLELTSMTPFDLCTVLPKVQVLEMMAPVFEQTEQQVIYEATHQRKNGSYYPVEVRLQLMNQAKAPQCLAIVLDISCRKEAEKAAKDQAALLRSVIDATPDLIFFKDKVGRYLGCNKAFSQYLQLNEPEIIGCTDSELPSEDRFSDFDLDDVKVIETGEPVVHNNWVRDGEGGKVLLQTSKTPYYDQQGEIQGVVGVSRDITIESKIKADLQEQKNLFEHDAHYDALTNLPNRLLFIDRLGQSIYKAKRRGEGVAVFFIDVDHFKPINDTLGHDVGDLALQQVSKRLTDCVREMDTIARLGGDEFTAIIEGITQPQAAVMIANKMNIALREPIVTDQHQIHVSASIGIAMYPDNGDNTKALLRCADKAMYRVKQAGRDSFQFYTQNVTGAALERALMESQLHAALKNSEFSLYYQAQLAMDSHEITGLEAFVRWQHPQLGTILPAKFIPLAEDVGLIQEIDEWVIETACIQMVKWKQQGLGDIRVAINLSSTEFIRNQLYDTIVEIIEDTGCSPSWLELEVNESCFIGDLERAKVLLDRFDELGIRLVIDNFGTGYSSLVNLRKLPISKLKIDRSFIHNVPQNSDDVSIAQAVINLGKSLGLQVVAEGVETEVQRDFLSSQDCQRAQGYLFSRPVSSTEMEQKLNLR